MQYTLDPREGATPRTKPRTGDPIDVISELTQFHFRLIDGTKTLVPSQHPRARHKLRAVGYRVLLVDSDNLLRHLRVDPENWLGSTVVSRESQVLQRRLIGSPFVVTLIESYRCPVNSMPAG